MAKEQKSKNPNGSKRVRYALLSILGAAVLVAATVFVVLWLVGDTGEPEVVERYVQDRPVLPTGGRGTVITEENLDEVRDEISRPIEDASYAAVMSVEWTFERWDIPSRDAHVENSTRNTRTVYFDVFLDGTNELIYSSPYIPVGAKLDGIALDTEVPAGSYTATVVYFLVDDDYEVLTDVSVMIWLNILG